MPLGKGERRKYFQKDYRPKRKQFGLKQEDIDAATKKKKTPEERLASRSLQTSGSSDSLLKSTKGGSRSGLGYKTSFKSGRNYSRSAASMRREVGGAHYGVGGRRKK